MSSRLFPEITERKNTTSNWARQWKKTFRLGPSFVPEANFETNREYLDCACEAALSVVAWEAGAAIMKLLINSEK